MLRGDDMLGTALALVSQFAPSIIGMLAGKKAEERAEAVVDVAKRITGAATPDEALKTIENNPELAVQFRRQAVQLEEAWLKEQAAVFQTIFANEKDNPHTTRPKIAWCSFQILAAGTMIVLGLWGYAVGVENKDMVKTVMDGWPFVVAVLAPFVALLRAYFGILRDEKKAHLQAGTGQPVQSGLGAIIQAFRK